MWFFRSWCFLARQAPAKRSFASSPRARGARPADAFASRRPAFIRVDTACFECRAVLVARPPKEGFRSLCESTIETKSPRATAPSGLLLGLCRKMQREAPHGNYRQWRNCGPVGRASRRHPGRRELLDGARSSYRWRRLTGGILSATSGFCRANPIFECRAAPRLTGRNSK